MKMLVTIIGLPVLYLGMLLADLARDNADTAIWIYIGFLYLIPFGLFYDKSKNFRLQLPELIVMNVPVALWYLLIRYSSTSTGFGNFLFEASAILTLFIVFSFCYFIGRKFSTNKYVLYSLKPYSYMTLFVLLLRAFMPEVGK